METRWPSVPQPGFPTCSSACVRKGADMDEDGEPERDGAGEKSELE